MNNVILVGRLTRDPEIKHVGSSQSIVAVFTIAVDRKYKSHDGIKKTDFIKIETWDKQAEFCDKYLKKGNLIGIEGELRVDKYETITGEIRFITKVRAYRFNFINSGNKENKQYNSSDIFDQTNTDTNFAEEEIPF